MSDFRSRISRRRLAVALVVLGALIAGLAGGFSSAPSPEPTVAAFLLAWEQGQYQMAAGYTTGKPRTVAAALRTAYRQLDAAAVYLSMGPIADHGQSAVATFNASVDLGQDGAPWTYRGRFTLHRAGSGWKVVWGPGVINPHLRPGLRLAVVTITPPRAPILDAGGHPLQTASPAFVAGVRPGSLKDPHATAVGLARATRLSASQILGWILAAPKESFLELVTLSPGGYRRLSGRLHRVPGLIIRQEAKRLFQSSASEVVGNVGAEASPVLRAEGVDYRPGTTIGLSGLELKYQSMLSGTPTTEVITEDSKGRRLAVLRRWLGRTPVPVRSTINGAVQSAASTAVRGQPRAAAVIAVSSKTGRILAAANQGGAGIPAPDALNGQFAPGQAFTIVSTAALLTVAGFSASTPIPCFSSNNVGGQTFRNDPPVRSLGAQPAFGADFANACGTAFAGLSRRLNAAQLAKAAASFGLGADWKLPVAGFAGSLRSTTSVAELAADTIGRGSVRVSPLAMALAAGQVSSGSWHPPSLVTDPADPGLATRAEVSGQVVGELQQLMRQAVHSGAAKGADLRGVPVYGQVGTAPAGSGKHRTWASWFVGYRGDVAFAVLVVSRSSSTSAVPLGRQFLSAVPGG